MDTTILEQHKQIYMQAGKELITNNTIALITDDILPLFAMPPLETMDLMKQRFFSIAKTENLILNTENLNEQLLAYRTFLAEKMDIIKQQRNTILTQALEKCSYNQPDQIIKELKKELVKLDKNIKKQIKQWLMEANKTYFLDAMSTLINDDKLTSSFTKEITKYLQTFYIKHVIEMIDMKLLVKDTTLLNAFKEQIERFIFTTENSHLFD